jgi:sugar O-acyltransferase (sialic acid O-acetyltransferase NeuD family)
VSIADDRVLELIGAGGHMLVVRDVVFAMRMSCRVWDGNAAGLGHAVRDIGVLDYDLQQLANTCFHVCIGDNATRQRLSLELVGSGAQPVTIRHPRSTVASTASYGEGCFVAAHAVVAPYAVLGDGVIVNHTCVVDHECEVGDFAHLAPGAVLGGRVQVGDKVLVGAGARILPGVTIGAGAIIGAGAVIVRDVPAHTTYIGVPGRAR